MGGYTLGLDIGANSIGWAVIDLKKPCIVGLGVRVFPEGVDRDTKGFEKSKNASRREARGARRIHQRRALRRRKLVRVLRETGLLPEGRAEMAEVLKREPYGLRAKGLDERLDLYELGRVLYQVSERRGFKSNRKSGKKKEDGQIAKGAGELQARIEGAGCRTLGEYFARVNSEEERIRGHHTFRSMYEDEFDLLWAKQAEFYPEVLTEGLRKRIRDEVIFYQRPLKPSDDLIGACDLEAGEKRCPRADWYARRFRIVQEVNNLKIVNPDGSVEELSKEQREKVLVELSTKREVRFSSLRKKLGLMERQLFNAEYEVGDKGKRREKIKGDEFAAGMRNKKGFGPKRWDRMSEEERIRLNGAFVDLEDDELVEVLIKDYGLSEDEVGACMKVELPRGYMRYSRNGIRRLLVLMEEGMREDQVVRELYPERGKRQEELQDKLGLPEDVRNPLVNRGMFEVRKVVNAIVREYGRPGEVVVEMARDVKGNSRERREKHWKIEANRKRNEEVRERLRTEPGLGMDMPGKPSRDDVVRYKLWEECGHTCPYTGKHIGLTALFSDTPEFQVEHILPYDRSLDDSFMNKTLCCVVENRRKGDQTPYEYYSGDAESFEQLKQRVNGSKMPYWKKRKFWQKEIDTDRIIERELNDTRYITREVVRYLRQVCRKVRGTRGKVTSELAYQWGLIKDREDHRHHAVDAVVAAVTRNNHLRELGRTKYSSTGESFAAPWAHFREEVVEKVKHINVSHRARRKVSGALHEETNYGLTGERDDKGQEIFVYRKKLEDLSSAMVSKIVDPVVRQTVRDRLVKHGIDPGKGEKISKEVWSEPLHMKSKTDKKIPIKKVRIREVFGKMIFLKDKSGKPYRAVAPGSNHHIEIFEYRDKRGKVKRDGEVVTMFEAVRRKQEGEGVVKRDHGPGKAFMCSLSMNEMFMLELDDGSEVLHRVQKLIQDGRIVLRPHTYAGKVRGSDQLPLIQRRSVGTLKGYKVAVDPLGRIHRAND
ncbi:MAG: type II CRISPR RNA-guided endonuclease Cas9 [Planctomycetota bacterium]|jgi:CRISPR-associated endonuclease Csn1